MKIHTVKLTEINPHLICALCNGYLINATTVVECLHTFCKSCIYNYLQNQQNTDNKKCCPICETYLSRSNPSYSLRPDPVLQNIVYSVVPNLYSLERERKVRFYEEEKMRQNILCSPNPSLDSIFGTQNKSLKKSTMFQITLRYLLSEKSTTKSVDSVPISVFNTPSKVTLTEVEQLLRTKFNLHSETFFEFYYSPKSECVKKYFSIDEIFRIMVNNDLILDTKSSHELPLFEKYSEEKSSSLAVSPDTVQKFTIFYRIYAVRSKHKRSNSEEKKDKKVGKVSKRKRKRSITPESPPMRKRQAVEKRKKSTKQKDYNDDGDFEDNDDDYDDEKERACEGSSSEKDMGVSSASSLLKETANCKFSIKDLLHENQL